LGLAKYLQEFGWKPVILTAKLPNDPALEFSVIQTPYKETHGLVKRLLGLDVEQNMLTQVAQLKKKLHIQSEKSVLDMLLASIGELTAYPDPQKSWKPFAIKTGNEFLQRESVDAIISTSPPVTSHLIARALKERYRIPWVADFRDLWTQNMYYPYSRLRKAIERRLESKTLQKSDALIVACEPHSIKMQMLYKEKRIYIITNGFDPDEVSSGEPKLTDKFTITYTGNLYPGKQSPEPLFIALDSLIKKDVIDVNDVEVRFYGAEIGWVERQAKRHGVSNIVRQYGIVPREIALSRQRDSQVLLFIKWNDPSERGFYSTKIFEYLAAKRPIIAVGGYEDIASELLDETKAGIDCSTAQKVEHAIIELYDEFRKKGQVKFKGNETKIHKYNQREMARKFSEVLDNVAA
jgi:glycosyltransferase involved in cell wall biosynthesis